MDQNEAEKKEYSGFPRKIKVGLTREMHTGTLDDVSVPSHFFFDPASLGCLFTKFSKCAKKPVYIPRTTGWYW